MKLIGAERARWLITGVAGFIGSHLLHMLLSLDQEVTGLDDLSTGSQSNLDSVKACVSPLQWQHFRFINGDIRNLDCCKQASSGVTYVLHHAALGSVPRSLEYPLRTNEANITGFLNMLIAAREAEIKRFVYAASSSTYGDHPGLPKVEERIGQPLSPYAVTKLVNELYANVFSRCYGLNSIGLRYFNVFGPRQDPSGAYAAVIPRWIAGLAQGTPIYVNGDGSTSRDFCYVHNVVQANLRAALVDDPSALNEVYNIAVGGRTTLNELFEIIRGEVAAYLPHANATKPVYREFRSGDVRHSQADISKAKARLGYEPTHDVRTGMAETVKWFMTRSRIAAMGAGAK